MLKRERKEREERKTVVPRDLGLSSSSFVAAAVNSGTPRAIINLEAEQKVGKTYWSLNTPDPIVFFNFDQGLRGVVEPFLREGKRIIIAGMPLPKHLAGKVYPSYHFGRPVPDAAQGEKRKSPSYLQRVSSQANPIWEKFISDYMEFLGSDARTGVIDTATAAWALGKFAYLGMDRTTSSDDPYGQKSGNLKSVFQGLVSEGLSHDKNVIWISRVKEEWKDGKPSGNLKNDGYNQLPYEVEMTVRLAKRKTKGKLVRGASFRDMRVGRPEDLEGEEFEGDEATFANMMALAYETGVEEWE